MALVLLAQPVAAQAGQPQAWRYDATYVALGDSYSAGEGLGGFEKGTDEEKGADRNQCHRSKKSAYPKLTKVVLPDVKSRSYVACAGATTADMKKVPPQQGPQAQSGQPRQVNVVGPDTQYVSLTAGGNDVQFSDVGIACVEAVVEHLAVLRAGSTSCDDQLEASEGRLGQLRADLSDLYTRVLTRSPDATVAVLGYPRVFPKAYDDAPELLGSPFCILDHYALPAPSSFLGIPVVNVIDVGTPTSVARQLDDFTVALNETIHGAVDDVRRDHPEWQQQLRFADTYDDSVPRNCKGTTKHASVAAVQLSIGNGISGDKWTDKLKVFLASSTLHPTKDGQKMMAAAAQRAFTTEPTPLTTRVDRQAPVTADAQIAAGYTVKKKHVKHASCQGGSDVTTAYRCFAKHGIYDPCYAVAERGTGDGVNAVCPTSPFSHQLVQLDKVPGLSLLTDDPFDAPLGLDLGNGTQCVAVQGAHDVSTDDRVVDYDCGNGLVVLRDLHTDTQPWSADLAKYPAKGGSARPSGTRAIVKAVLALHDVPPANRPVTDAGGATARELDLGARVHHEVDCGQIFSDPSEPTTYVSGVDCGTGDLLAIEWETGNPLEPGWSCDRDLAGTLLCQQADVVSTDPAAFFSSAHVRAR